MRNMTKKRVLLVAAILAFGLLMIFCAGRLDQGEPSNRPERNTISGMVEKRNGRVLHIREADGDLKKITVTKQVMRKCSERELYPACVK